ncbi:ATP-binding cassette domain-containing protein [Pseudoxanthobacter sp.]|uniref:ATP-binding cassette domain-containing protein n=1 Tax=Pseudoxanthobacter sp. TaxID=1925742 RepID=UPI002FDF4B31
MAGFFRAGAPVANAFRDDGSGPLPAGPGTSAAEPAFRFSGVSKAFGPKTVLSSIDLTVEQGEFVAIIGKSGCGKSTLLRLIAGLEAPTAGRLVHAGGAEDSRDTRIMFQEPRLLPWARILANVEVGLTGLREGAAGRARAQALLAEVGLAERAGEWPSVLSGGQKQRVALARALVGNPRILALDEPLGALDALTRIEMQRLIETIWQEQRFTAVLVTHDVSEAVALADRVVLIEAGRVALDLAIAVPRPRRRGSPELAALEGRLLDRLLGV